MPDDGNPKCEAAQSDGGEGDGPDHVGFHGGEGVKFAVDTVKDRPRAVKILERQLSLGQP